MKYLLKPVACFLRIIAVLGLILMVFRCTRKSKAPNGLEAWLEHAFPGRFVVLQTNIADPIKHLSFKVKNSIIAERSDSLVQIALKWDKREKELGLVPSEIARLAERAQQRVRDIKTFGNLMEKAGMKEVAYCVHHSDVVILHYVEPTPRNRLGSLKTLEQAVKQWPEAQHYGLLLFLIHPKRQDEVRLKGVFGMDHWINYQPEIVKKSTVYVKVADMGSPFEAATLNKEWTLCLDHDELNDQIFSQKNRAMAWGKKHLSKPFVIMDLLEFENLEKGLGVKVKYPFSFDAAESSDSIIHGYICADYVLDDDSQEELHQWRIEMESERKYKFQMQKVESTQWDH